MIFVDGIVKVRFCGKVVIQLRRYAFCQEKPSLSGFEGTFEGNISTYVDVSEI